VLEDEKSGKAGPSHPLEGCSAASPTLAYLLDPFFRGRGIKRVNHIHNKRTKIPKSSHRERRTGGWLGKVPESQKKIELLCQS